MAEEFTGGPVNYYVVGIKHPARDGWEPYQAHCQDIIEALGMTFNEGENFKAIWRMSAARTLGQKKAHDQPTYNGEKCEYFGHRIAEQERHRAKDDTSNLFRLSPVK